MCMVRDHGRNEFSFPEYRMIKSIQDARHVKKGVPIICSALNKYVACSYWFGGQSGLLPHRVLRQRMFRYFHQLGGQVFQERQSFP